MTTPSVALHILGIQLNAADHLIENSQSGVADSIQTYGLAPYQRKIESLYSTLQHCNVGENISELIKIDHVTKGTNCRIQDFCDFIIKSEYFS